MAKINLLELENNDVSAPIEIVKLGENETPVIPFTPEGEALALHYCEETELKGYVRCNGKGCPLCRIGRKVDQRIVLPVYMPTSGVIGALLVPTTRTPHALLPQLLNSVRSGRREVVFIKREAAKYTVTSRPLADGEQDGAKQIKDFLQKEKNGEIQLEQLVNTLSNEDLTEIPGIARHLELKGITGE